MEDYSKLGKITLEDSGLLSSTSVELREFIKKNKLEKIKDFLKFMDKDKFDKDIYYDVLLEARGLADLLKYKYLNIDFITDVYFDKTIQYMKFKKIATSFSTYGINIGNERVKELKDIYSVISRLGFNEKERDFILDVPIDYLDGVKVIDLLNNAYNRLLVKTKTNKEDIILSSKIYTILGYYLITNKPHIQSHNKKHLKMLKR